MNEIILLKGMFADAKKRYKEADLEASALIVAIRNVLNPFEDDLSLIDTEKALIMMKRLNELVTNLKELKSKIKKLEQDLNG